MSNPSPSLPPLPPPTVPSQNPLPLPPPPQPKHPPASSSPTLSAHLQDSPASYSPTSSHTSQNQPQMAEYTDLHQHSDDDFPKKSPSRTCSCRLRLSLTPHHIHEPARSLWLDTRILLLFRLAVTAILLGHLVFFSLRGDFSYRLYSTWNYAGLSLAFLLVLICSLLDVVRDEDSNNDNDIGTTQGEGMVTDVERQPLGSPQLPDPKLARALTRVAVPLYQIFFTATLFGAIVYWAAIHDFSVTSISYPLIILKIFAPAAPILDFLFSLRMRFRLLYVLLYTLYNALYVGALVLFDKLQGDPVYALFDPSVQSKEQFIAKTAGIGGASVAAGLLIYAFSYIPLISCSCFSGKKTRPKKKPDSVNGSDSSPTSASDDTSDSSGLKPLNDTDRDGHNKENTDSTEFARGSRKDLGRFASVRSIKKDRLSLPVGGSGTMTPSTSGQWFRSSSARLVASRSGSSIGSDRQDPFPRNDSGKRSTWETLHQPSARVEDEYFAMPAASGEREVIKLAKPMPRDESASSLPGLLSRSGSGRMSRSGSRRMSRSGSSRSILVRSQSGRSGAARSFAKSGSEPVLR